MKMRIWVLNFTVLVSFALVATCLNAQQPSQQSKQEAMQRLEKMSTELKLTPQQKEQIRPILMDEAPKLKALRENTSLGKMQKAMQMRQIQEDTDAKLKPILNDQQYQQLIGMQEQQRQQMIEKARQQ